MYSSIRVLRLRHAQVAHHVEARVQARLLLQRLVEFHGVVVDVARRVGHVEQRQKPGRMPGGAGGQLVPFQQHHILPPRPRKVIGDGRADGTAADDKGFDMGLHGPTAPDLRGFKMLILPAQRPVRKPCSADAIRCENDIEGTTMSTKWHWQDTYCFVAEINCFRLWRKKGETSPSFGRIVRLGESGFFWPGELSHDE
jgi:hypothetical protein